MNCCVTETKGHAVPVKELNEPDKIRQRAGQPVDLVDHDHIDFARAHILEQPLQRRSLGIAAGEAAIAVVASQQRPARMGLTSDIGLSGIVLGIQRIEVLFEPSIARYPGVDGRTHLPGCGRGHRAAPFPSRSDRPKKRGPLQRVRVMARATADRLG